MHLEVIRRKDLGTPPQAPLKNFPPQGQAYRTNRSSSSNCRVGTPAPAGEVLGIPKTFFQEGLGQGSGQSPEVFAPLPLDVHPSGAEGGIGLGIAADSTDPAVTEQVEQLTADGQLG